MSTIDKHGQLARAILQTVNRTQARGSTVRIVVPRDSDVTDELGIDPDADRLQSAVEHLLERGYIVPADVGLTRGAYTITRAGLLWLSGDRSEPPDAAR
jgi:predicted transcriptional regulator